MDPNYWYRRASQLQARVDQYAKLLEEKNAEVERLRAALEHMVSEEDLSIAHIENERLRAVEAAARMFHDLHAFQPQTEGDSHWCRLCQALEGSA